MPKKAKTDPLEDPKYCADCDQRFAKDRHYLMHFKKIHKTVPPEYQDKPQYTCEVCDYFCFTKLGLDLHHRNKHTDNPAPKRNTKLKMSQKNCPIIGCGKVLSSEQRLKQHIANIHETNKSFKCQSCHKAFGTMQGKRQHLKVAKACGKKVAKLENQSAKRQQQQIKAVPRAQVVAVTTANQTIFYRNEAQMAVEALNEISFR